ncbi:sodium-dependent transporter [Pseudidiomarina donghaiensis]|uniref:Sodium-dependent transporter n=1 Tax=Pseudidiomarina donghaiensis TaxID=519452 RepID=A0A432XEE6_9GAMM|nr:sodium-dependent transporter [Pseudidiomarina donghaiensis]RUO47006.1 sodium-dependent transporter [Pseudidiomarina donghaiensis]SFV23427.1 neurotransmitter:Na+ symporter, NSS family [Pseudidiomarina donghaiensis]
MSAQREHFSSKIGFILAAAGSAVGIGNLVGFPVAATKNGGGAFLLIYAAFVLFICLPVMLAEMGLGRRAQHSPYRAYAELGQGLNRWRIAGWLATITPFMIAVFYMVITVWIFGYLIQSFTGNLDQLATAEYFGQFVNDYNFVAYLVGVTIIINFILIGGVRKGIERASKILMPTLFLMLVLLVIFVLTLDNAWAGVEFYLVPDFSKIDGSVINGALAQAFFSLSLGMGILITYGSYFRRSDDIVTSGKLVAATDTAVAFIAGLMTLPAIFAIYPETNPESLSDSSVSMIFSFFPNIFLALSQSIGYAAASVAATIFFLLAFVAAITSLVSIIEVPTSSLMEKKNISRKQALVYMGIALTVLTLIAATSFGLVPLFSEFTSYAGSSKSVFDVIYDVFYDTILPLNGLLICLFVRFRWKREQLTAELSEGNANYKTSWLEKYVSFAIGTFIPLILAVVFTNTVLTKFFGYSFL